MEARDIFMWIIPVIAIVGFTSLFFIFIQISRDDTQTYNSFETFGCDTPTKLSCSSLKECYSICGYYSFYNAQNNCMEKIKPFMMNKCSQTN